MKKRRKRRAPRLPTAPRDRPRVRTSRCEREEEGGMSEVGGLDGQWCGHTEDMRGR